MSWRTGAELVLHTEKEDDMAEALDSGSRDDDELMLNVLRCQLTY